ncbi:MAG: DUF262 and DUF1524 domain-containing protein [Sedimentibacter sp.]|uniref:DUF262 and DUF1524 domain-containing protein n=1 Tax=Sedimentibacter sp. TaxID=1960295 RepID=UPI003159003A
MKAGETSLQKLMNGAIQFIVPIYQRTYSWTFKQCNQLWKDIIQITNNKKDMVHFIGSVVYIDLGTPIGKPQQLLLIDGQQRLTTLSLLLCALSRHIEKNNLEQIINPNKIKNYFLINSEESGNDKYKILLTEQDKDTYVRILEGTEKTLHNPSEQMLRNFDLFTNIIEQSGESIETIYEGINRLMLVSVALDKTQDNPQLIFESMNSTGKDLSQADLIRNYILMDQSPDMQTKLYTTYWRPMEQGFGQQGYTDYFDLYIRDFLTSHNSSGRICKINEVYEAFKQYHKSGITAEQLLNEVFIYAQYYIRIHLGKEDDNELKILWEQIRLLDVSVCYPFLMRIYNDYENKVITKSDFITIIKATISYVVRRVICEIPTNSLNKTFSTFYQKIKKDKYVSSILCEYVVKDSYRVFPTDDEFKVKFINKEIYKLRIRNYILESLENRNHKEPISIIENGYTIEHIMPQNPNLNSDWKNMLGPNWKETQKNLLHTIGNLTLTGYNSEMSDKPFNVKQTIEGGFKKSHLRLNYNLGDLLKWDELEIKERADDLAEQAINIWEYPNVSQTEIDFYTKSEKKENTYTSIEHYPHMSDPIKTIYNELDRKLLNLDTYIFKEYKKHYIAYKNETNFVNIKPSRDELTVAFNIPFENIKDDKGLCLNYTGIGNFASNDVLLKVDETSDLSYVINIAKQALNYQHGDVYVDNGVQEYTEEYYATFGVSPEGKAWEDAVKYGFISADGGAWYTKSLQLLSIGDRVWVYVPQNGFAGVGIVAEESQPAKTATFEVGSNKVKFIDLPLLGHYGTDTSDDKQEYLVKVEWIKTFDLKTAIWETGFFANQNSVCRPQTDKWKYTVECLKREWEIE